MLPMSSTTSFLPLFCKQTLNVLKPLHEAWSGIPLIGSIAYGLRIYRNDSQLNMHTDRSNTHVISCILHVDHDDDPESEPWPIVIEDFQGNMNEVVLESGDMLFYESSKCLHGRPKRFKGKWYSSIFVHYYPAENWEVSHPSKCFYTTSTLVFKLFYFLYIYMYVYRLGW